MSASVEQRSIAYGDTGVEQILNAMGDTVDAAMTSASVVGFARTLVVQGGAIRDQDRAAQVIKGWLARVWRFVDDPTQQETLRDPLAMLMEYTSGGVIMGDCDEAAILGATLGMAVGMGAQLIAIALPNATIKPPPFVHVYATLLTNTGGVVSLDVTKPRGPVPPTVRTMTMEL